MDINFAAYDLSDPTQRRSLLEQISPDRETIFRIHKELLEVFKREIEFSKTGDTRRGVGDDDDFENLYWCALLLYLVGDTADVPLLWQGKQTTMDTASGLDVQFLVGAGVEATIQYAEAHGHEKIAKYLCQMRDAGEFNNLPE
jgi:hypothetical protein